FNLKRFAEAANMFEKLIKGYPTAPIVPEATLKQAECYRELGNFAKAAELYRKFQTQYAKNALIPQAMLGEAWVLFKQKKTDAAKAIVQKMEAAAGQDASSKLDALFLLGQILTDEKNFDAARGVYKQIAGLRGNPRATEGLFLAAEAMFDAKRYADAIT